MATLHMCQNLTTCQYLGMAETNGNKNCEAHGGAFPYHIETFVQEDSSRSGRLGELTESLSSSTSTGREAQSRPRSPSPDDASYLLLPCHNVIADWTKPSS